MLTKTLTALFGKKRHKKSLGSLFSESVRKSGYRAAHAKRVGERGERGTYALLLRWIRARVKSAFAKKLWSNLIAPVRGLALLLVLLFVGYQLASGPLHSLFADLNYFRINDIEISGCRNVAEEELKKFAALSYEMNMLNLEPKDIEKRIVQHPWIKSAKVRRIWPDTLGVLVEEYRPQAVFVREDGETIHYLNNKGVAFAKVLPGKEMDFPIISGIGESVADSEKKEMLKEANHFLRLAERNNPNLPAQNVSELHFTTKGELVLYLVEHPFPIYFGKGEVSRKFDELLQVLGYLYRRHKGKTTIDDIAYIRMDYQLKKVLVAKKQEE